jgi:hypothetical protein
VRRAASRIGQHPEPAGAVTEHELHRLPRIVRHRIGLDFQPVHRERRMAVDHLHRHPVEILCHHQRAGGQPHRQLVLARQPPHAADMIAVFVGHHNAGEIPRLQPQTGQPGYAVGEAETTIHQHPGTPGFHHQTVALAAAAETGEPHYLRSRVTSILCAAD